MHTPAATLPEVPALSALSALSVCACPVRARSSVSCRPTTPMAPAAQAAKAEAAAQAARAEAASPAPQLRPVAPEDLPAMRAFVQGLSASSRRLRFHGGLKPDSDRLLRHLTGADGVRHVAWVAVRPCNDGDVIVGEAHWVRTGEATAEFAVVVADAWHGHGLAQALLARLLQAAKDAGIATLTADVLDDNARMATFLQRQGFEVDRPACAEAGVRTWRKALPAHAARSIRTATPGWKALASRLLGGWALPALSA